MIIKYHICWRKLSIIVFGVSSNGLDSIYIVILNYFSSLPGPFPIITTGFFFAMNEEGFTAGSV